MVEICIGRIKGTILGVLQQTFYSRAVLMTWYQATSMAREAFTLRKISTLLPVVVARMRCTPDLAVPPSHP